MENKIDEGIEKIFALKNNFTLEELIKVIDKTEDLSLETTENPRCLGLYNKEINTIFVNETFGSSAKDKDKTYILLHEYFHSLEKRSSFFAIGHQYDEEADVFARGFFKEFYNEEAYEVKYE